MIRNYYTVAVRTLVRNKLYTLLNVAGLTFGLTCFLLIGLYLFDELTFDRQHANADRIYRVVEHKNVKGDETTIAAASYNLAEESKRSIPEVENTTRIKRIGRANLVDPENPVNFQETVTVVDQDFLQIFDFPLISGDKKTALKEPYSILINEDLAMRLFGTVQVLGKKLQWGHLDSPHKITGVLKNHPRNSSFDFNNVISEVSNSDGSGNFASTDWSSNGYAIYALLRADAEPETVSAKMTRLVLSNFKPEKGTSLHFSLQALKDLHLYSENITDGARNTNVEPMPQGNPAYVRMFSLVSLFVLFIAGINYMNLSTARASNRAREIGVRKSIGAVRKNLVYQFLFEALLITGLSFVLAVLLLNLALGPFNDFTGKELTLGFSTNYRIWLMAIGATILIGLISGSYPALLLSGFKPVALLKGMKINQGRSLGLRKGLVVFQFTVSIVLIIGTIVLYRQVRFMNNTHLGFDKDLLVVIDVNTSKARSGFEAIKAEMATIPTVKSVSVTSRVPGEWKTYRRVKIHAQGNHTEPTVAYFFGADKDFLSTYDVRLVSGRNFVNPSDSTSVLLNETAARMLNITDPAGQFVEIPLVSSNGGDFEAVNTDGTPFKAKVIGIVRDFHFQSLREKIAPLVLGYNRNPVHGIDYYTAKIEAANIPATLDRLKAAMVRADGDDPFEYHFLNDQLARFYMEDHRRQTLMIWTALAAIFIACLGLFGLATYSAEQRVKEIGIRKVLGATAFSLATLLSKDFLILVLISNLLAFPVAWWAVSTWLQEYAYHVNLEWWIFVLAAVLAVAIALLTVSYQSVKASLVNPLDSLKSD
ncbi:putative ABC transport system permease protein [Dyadobacter sp. SG02]|uniref:ABC transporter permease n=1 Tax=Dyadobacter sp. SG02 TaxID=1855291 RepID=UPI0008AFACCB|nr:ABC transporter permease [Dyadobacter sp. SG02]SEI53363.1 putative ABC transport system permease protein [Dyadobacter sp. SG02]